VIDLQRDSAAQPNRPRSGATRKRLYPPLSRILIAGERVARSFVAIDRAIDDGDVATEAMRTRDRTSLSLTIITNEHVYVVRKCNELANTFAYVHFAYFTMLSTRPTRNSLNESKTRRRKHQFTRVTRESPARRQTADRRNVNKSRPRYSG